MTIMKPGQPSDESRERAEKIVQQYMSWDAAGYGACVDAELKMPDLDPKDAANAIVIFMREKTDKAIAAGKPVQLAWIDANQVIKCAEIIRSALAHKPEPDAVDVDILKSEVLAAMCCQSEIILCFDTMQWMIDHLNSYGLLRVKDAAP